MRKHLPALFASMLLAAPLGASAEGVDPELAFMPRTMTVTLLNEGGKYVAVDLKHIPKGGSCRMDQDATIIRVGPGATPATTRVRYAAPQLSSGGCPFLTVFELADADYASARAAFVRKEGEAKHTVEQLKKDLGEKWDEVTGKKKELVPCLWMKARPKTMAAPQRRPRTTRGSGQAKSP
jgi:hypothetical protein